MRNGRYPAKHGCGLTEMSSDDLNPPANAFPAARRHHGGFDASATCGRELQSSSDSVAHTSASRQSGGIMIQLLTTVSRYCNKILIAIGGLVLVGMIVLTCGNIFSRLVWIPIKGTFELMGFFGAVVTAFALGSTQVARGHIAVDVLVNRFSHFNRRITELINNVLCCLFFGVAAWQLVLKANTLRQYGEVTETLRIVYYPFVYAVALGCAVLALVMLVNGIQLLLFKKGGKG
jgi:TRAP-type C4-dicarboxylate transport system permease small subunit